MPGLSFFAFRSAGIFPHGPQNACHTNRGETAAYKPKQQRQGEFKNGLNSEMPRCNHQNQHADTRRKRCVQRPSKALGYAGIHQFIDTAALVKIHILSDAVIDYDRIVDGIADEKEKHPEAA